MTVIILDFSTLSGTNLQIWTLKGMTSTYESPSPPGGVVCVCGGGGGVRCGGLVVSMLEFHPEGRLHTLMKWCRLHSV